MSCRILQRLCQSSMIEWKVTIVQKGWIDSVMKNAIGILTALMLTVACTTAFALEKNRFTVTVVDNLPTTTAYEWHANGQPVVTCYSNACEEYITRDYSNRNKMRAEVKLLLPDGRILIVGCYRGGIGTNVACLTPQMDSTIDIIEYEGAHSIGQVDLLIPKSNKDPSKVHSAMYFIKGFLVPTHTIPNTNNGNVPTAK